MDDRRKFSRIFFNANAYIAQANIRWPTRIIDLCLNGALVERPPRLNPDSDDLVLHFTLPNSDVSLQMKVEATHQDTDWLGLRTQHIDVESISHLRRLIELNLADTNLLDRELNHFIEQHQNANAAPKNAE
ncbi:PilZ domain-containing protein [Shewanella sp. NIFS-20-20]|uniref:PilZ domain-containing protein n=1 Tax=Shewanella sp. NIFS-20-20 TaxID=2853806 RepID=UPI001C4411FF|nr:PilZ domain-containing protein [Shewanella sp. NIFS-20-20]MBV7314939.1 PilZ domain-containing protein [Shewanella sp. NIFS-20-20]